MSEDKKMPQKTPPDTTDTVEETEVKQMTSGLGPATGEKELRDPHSQLSKARGTNTFIKSTSEDPRSDMQPIPWPMPPKLHSTNLQSESSSAVSDKRDTDGEYLTPQSSFAQNGSNTTLDADFAAIAFHKEGSGASSRECSMKQESFSSFGTGASLAMINSSDSGSTESVSRVHIDADEFSRLQSEKAKPSSGVNFKQLFAEEGVLHGEIVCSPHVAKENSPELPGGSSTPKAMRAPFKYKIHEQCKKNTVSLTEALNFNSDDKEHPDKKRAYCERQSQGPTKEESDNIKENRSISNRVEKQTAVPSSGGIRPLNANAWHSSVRQDESFDINNNIMEEGNVPGLRRPLASKRKTLVILPHQKDETSFGHDKLSQGGEQDDDIPRPQKEIVIRGQDMQRFDIATTPPPVKGVIMRAQNNVSLVAGIRRAETGRIMSRAELRAQNPILLHESPNPKSLNPVTFSNEDEDVTTVNPSTLFPESSSDSDNVSTAQSTRSKPTTGEQNLATKKAPVGQKPSLKTDDGSFLSPGLLSRKKKFGAEDYRVDSFQFSEQDESSGLLNRFSSGFRKMHIAVAKKSSSHEVPRADGSGIIVPGTIDEAVCKICVVCRKQLECNVYVKDTGKKIKVESRNDGRKRYLRATILVRQMPGTPFNCELNIRQSRTDGMRTSLATLWSFYQRLEGGLNELG